MITDLRIIQPPAVTFGPSGFSFVEPEFNTRIIRATDEDTDNGKSYTMGSTGGVNLWSRDSRLFAAQHVGGGWQIFSFDAKSFTVKPVVSYSSNRPSIHFSTKDANVWFVYQNGVVYKFTKNQGFVIWCDFGLVLPVGYNIKWHSTFSVSRDEKACTMAFSNGSQNSAHLIVSYREGKGFRLLDTGIGLISGDWGYAGRVDDGINDPKQLWQGFEIHGCQQMKDSNFATFGSDGESGGVKFLWPIEGVRLYPVAITGHMAEGFDKFVTLGDSLKVRYQDFFSATIREVAEGPRIDPKPSQDSHYSWNSKDDDSRILVSTASPSRQIVPYPKPGWNEILTFDLKGNLYRHCHTFNDLGPDDSDVNFAVKNSIAVISPDGKWAAWAKKFPGNQSHILIAKLT